MNEIINNEEKEFVEWVKTVITRQCPIVDDRFYLLDMSAQEVPQLDINFDFENGLTRVGFMYGVHSFKKSIEERAIVNKYISVSELEGIIDFILEDHERFVNFLLPNKLDNSIKMIFDIRWYDTKKKGMECDEICLNMNFNADKELSSKYSFELLDYYKDKYCNTFWYKSMESTFIDSQKEIYFKSVPVEELHNYIKQMKEEDLRELLINVDNESFKNYFVKQNKTLKYLNKKE